MIGLQTGHFPGTRRHAIRWVAMSCAVVIFALATASPLHAQDAPSRLAFVVGNAAYDTEVPRAARDARDMAETLEGLGFTVTLLLNSDAATFSAALDSFATRVDSSEKVETVLFYFSGHSAEIAGETQLLPIDIPLTDLAGARSAAVPLARVLDRIGRGTRPTIALLDASRPMPQDTDPGITPGFGRVVPGRETYIASAAQPGRTAPERAGGRNSRFTQMLVSGLGAPGQPIDRVVGDLREIIVARTDAAQEPWSISTLSQPVFLNPFRPDEGDFERLAGMPKEQQDFLLEIWRGQGADITREEIAMRQDGAPDPEPPVARENATDPLREQDAGTAPDAADATENPVDLPQEQDAPAEDGPVFVFEPLEEETPQVQDDPDSGSAPAPMTGDDPGTIALSGDTGDTAGPSGLAGDAPISRLSGVAAPPGPAPRSLADLEHLLGEDITESWLVPDDLAVAVQEELKRVGCYTAGIDGIWGGGSRRALAAYLRESGESLNAREPTAEVWRSVKEASGQVCAPPPAPAPTASPSRQPAPSVPAPSPAPTQPSGTSTDSDRLQRALGSGFR
ncbi:caspase family protein [Salibaculum sp.]|uniref:caspase family protein n=1 Tax=Salibaculum sp. TaxID=2855480 RepID=UPI002B49B789|nr:caspase family protein [Salibaculum sp.]HKL69585.1 caspase family protein [Salibaculum sp.]